VYMSRQGDKLEKLDYSFTTRGSHDHSEGPTHHADGGFPQQKLVS